MHVLIFVLCPAIPNTTPFWNSAPHYSYINWAHPDEETDFFPGSDVGGSWELGDDLYVGLRFESKEDAKMGLKYYCFKRHQTYKILESKPTYFTANCPNHLDGCLWRMRARMDKNIDKWVISRWVGPHTCVNPMRSQDHTKMTSDVICSYILGMIVVIYIISLLLKGILTYNIVNMLQAW